MNVINVSDLKDDQVNSLKDFIEKGATKEQAKEYGLGLFNNIDINKINNLELSAEKMRQIRLGEQEHINTDLYKDFDADKMAEVRYGLICAKQDNREIEKYLTYSTEQLKLINDGYNLGLTVDEINLYAKEDYSAEIMESLMNSIKNGEISNESDVFKAIQSGIGQEKQQIEDVDNKELQEEKEPIVEEQKDDNVIEKPLESTIENAREENNNETTNDDFDLGDLSDFFDIG